MAQLLIADAALLDPRAGELRPGCFLLAEDDRIVEVSEREIRAPDARRVEARGRTLMPGLIDAHVHAMITTMNLGALQGRPLTLISQEARLVLEGMLQRGFTSVRDAAGADWGIAEACDRGLIRGPRVFYSGMALSQTGGHGDFRSRTAEVGCACQIHSQAIAHIADGVPAVRRAAREELRRGATQVKIMASGGVASPTDPIWNVQYSHEEMAAIVEEAAGWRTYAMAHAYTPEAIRRAVDAGVRSIEHGNLIDAETARLMASRQAFLVPTLVTYFAMDEMGRQLGFPAVSLRKVKDVLDAGLASLEIATEAGVKIGFGTDLLGEAHDQQSREFRIRAEVLEPLDVIRSATLVNAELLNRTGELGELVPGALADLLLVDGDPTRDLSLLEGQGKNLSLIVKGGLVMKERS